MKLLVPIFLVLATLASHPRVSAAASSRACRPSGTLRCGSRPFPRFQCSPPVTSSTRATLTNNDFGKGGGPSKCTGRFLSNAEPIVALSTGWYDGGSRCGEKIRIKSKRTGKTVLARVVDECDSMNGCDGEHANQPPCKNNIVDGSNAVWKALGLNVDAGLEDITWSTA